MKSFSQRQGFKPIRSIIQRECADEPLRNSLWNALTIFYWNSIHIRFHHTDPDLQALLRKIWVWHYQNRLDELDAYTPTLLSKIKEDFLNLSWNEMFDILEFVPNNFKYGDDQSRDDNENNTGFITFANDVLEEHLSAYRFVDKLIVEISSEEEIASIEEALIEVSKFKPVQAHLRRALELFADRENPDYRNSIKESISAIESFSCIITQNPKSTLAQALKEVEKNHDLHSAL